MSAASHIRMRTSQQIADTLSILVVDDEAPQREVLAGYLRKKGFSATQAATVDEALRAIRESSFDLVLTDFQMPARTGVDLLVDVRKIHPDIPVVLMTAYGTVQSAVEAMKAGAYDYLTKPIDLDALELIIARIRERQQLLSEIAHLREQIREKYSFDNIIAASRAMEDVLATAARVAPSKAPVLVRGESGTGKELIARAIHAASPRASSPFVALNTAALNENLLESELFGHEKGAFTGADRQRKGRFEQANGGTLFLDEIGDIPLATQVRLLRVLQEGAFERVGGSELIQVDVRIVAATHKDLEHAMREGSFREDLFYRLNVVTVQIPPLRERREDIPSLLEHYLRTYADDHGRPDLRFSGEAHDLLLRYAYPGNVRELENIVQRAVILSRGDIITTGDLPRSLLPSAPEASASSSGGTLPELVERLEKQLVMDALQASGGNQSRAAEALGISERNLRYRLQKWGVKTSRE